MSYKVYFLDGYEITNVESVDFGHEREVKTFDGIGQGKFLVPETKNLKTWSVKCQQDGNTSLFDVLEKMLDNNEDTRLIITSDVENMSEAVLLCGYSKTEQDVGVYDVVIQFREYKEVSVKTTDIPYIPRPGKIPKLPETVTFGNGNTPYRQALKKSNFEIASGKANGTRNRTSLYESEFGEAKLDKNDKLYMSEFSDKETGKPIINQCFLKSGKPYTYNQTTGEYYGLSPYEEYMIKNAWRLGKSEVGHDFRHLKSS